MIIDMRCSTPYFKVSDASRGWSEQALVGARRGCGEERLDVGRHELLDDVLARVNPKTHEITRTVRLPPGTDGVAVGEGSVWVASAIAGTVTRIDPRTGMVLATIDVGRRPEDVAVGAGGVWVTRHPA